MVRKNANGFTLIELMIAVGIIGVLSSIALMSYSNYMESSRATTLNHNFSTGIRFARDTYMTAAARTVMGANAEALIPTNSAGWVTVMNSNSSAVIYSEGAGNIDNATIGVVFAGTYGGNDSTVTLTRPAYAGLPESIVTVAQTDF